MFTVFLWPLMVHASLGNSGTLSCQRQDYVKHLGGSWSPALAPAQAGHSSEGVTEALVDNPPPRLWALHSGGQGRGWPPLSPSQGFRDIQSWFCIIWGWFTVTCNCSFVMPFKALGGEPFQIFHKNIKETSKHNDNVRKDISLSSTMPTVQILSHC